MGEESGNGTEVGEGRSGAGEKKKQESVLSSEWKFAKNDSSSWLSSRRKERKTGLIDKTDVSEGETL